MTEMDLLKAVNDIDEEWIIEAEPSFSGTERMDGADRVVSLANVRRPAARHIGKTAAFISAAAAVAAIIFVSFPLLKRGQIEKTAAVSEAAEQYDAAEEDHRILLGGQAPQMEEAAEDGEEAYDFMANPFVEYESIEAARTATGLTMNVPEEYAGSRKRIVRCSDFGMMEIIYEDAGGEELFRIRKQEGSDDISGDYHEYSYRDVLECSSCKAEISGEDRECISVAVWQKEGFSYALDAGAYLFTREEVSELVDAVI